MSFTVNKIIYRWKKYLLLIELFTVNNNNLPLIELITVNNNNLPFIKSFTISRIIYRQ